MRISWYEQQQQVEDFWGSLLMDKLQTQVKFLLSFIAASGCDLLEMFEKHDETVEALLLDDDDTHEPLLLRDDELWLLLELDRCF